MTSSRRLVLELERTDDPIAGRVVDERGVSCVFIGWIGLGRALASLLNGFHQLPKEGTP